MKNLMLSQGKELQKNLTEYYRYLHQNAEVGFELPKTVEFVKTILDSIGCEYTDCGKSGVVAVIGKGDNSQSFMLRGDMDGLPMAEKTGLSYACENGNMHACGHDMHTTMLLGAAAILKKNENNLKGKIKLMFQPAEEILCGASNMIENGVLDNPRVSGALMLHVMSGVNIPAGSFIVSSGGISAPAADYFTINIHGKSTHGSTPHNGIDPITAGAQILLALQEIQAREIAVDEGFVMTVGLFNGGSAGNVIAESVVMQGTLRAFCDDTRNRVKKRVQEICENIGKAFRVNVCLTYEGGCPTLLNNGDLSEKSVGYLKDLFGNRLVLSADNFKGKSLKGGSEDFSYISHKVPALMIALGAGECEKGFQHSAHHPKVVFDESVLWRGSVALAYLGAKFTEDLNNA